MGHATLMTRGGPSDKTQALPEDSSDRMRVTLGIGTTAEGWAYLSVSDTGPEAV